MADLKTRELRPFIETPSDAALVRDMQPENWVHLLRGAQMAIFNGMRAAVKVGRERVYYMRHVPRNTGIAFILSLAQLIEGAELSSFMSSSGSRTSFPTLACFPLAYFRFSVPELCTF